jgi:hypothetical protein
MARVLTLWLTWAIVRCILHHLSLNKISRIKISHHNKTRFKKLNLPKRTNLPPSKKQNRIKTTVTMILKPTKKKQRRAMTPPLICLITIQIRDRRTISLRASRINSCNNRSNHNLAKMTRMLKIWKNYLKSL